MLRGKHVVPRPSGSQQRKRKQEKENLENHMKGSMLKFIVLKSRKNAAADDEDDGSDNDEDLGDPGDGIEGDNGDVINEIEIEMSDISETGMGEKDDMNDSAMNNYKINIIDNETPDYEVEENENETVNDDGNNNYIRDDEVPASDVDRNIMNQLIINNEEINETDTSLSELDPFYWKIPVSDSFRVQLVQIGSGPFQNKDGPFKSTPREYTKGNIRNLTLEWFYQVMPDGEKVLRKWMVYSPGSGNLYCFCCRLFTNTINDSSSSFITGFNTWWKLNPKVRDHEKSSNHLDHLEKWKTLAVGLKLKKTIDDKNLEALETKNENGETFFIVLLISLFSLQNKILLSAATEKIFIHRIEVIFLNWQNCLPSTIQC